MELAELREVTQRALQARSGPLNAWVGIAIDEGAIASVSDPISKYAPSLVGGAYDGVPIEHVLQMCSGARWLENYADPNSDAEARARAPRDGIAIDWAIFQVASLASKATGYGLGRIRSD